MKQFHCIVGNKGGVGKSLAASWLIQYGLEQGWNVLPIECDQGNRTLSRYGRLGTERLELLDPEHQVDRRRFDALLETLVADTEPCVVMDNGQASFTPLTRYMSECLAFDMLRDARRDCFVHIVLAGGQLGASTLAGLRHVRPDLLAGDTEVAALAGPLRIHLVLHLARLAVLHEAHEDVHELLVRKAVLLLRQLTTSCRASRMSRDRHDSGVSGGAQGPAQPRNQRHTSEGNAPTVDPPQFALTVRNCARPIVDFHSQPEQLAITTSAVHGRWQGAQSPHNPRRLSNCGD